MAHTLLSTRALCAGALALSIILPAAIHAESAESAKSEGARSTLEVVFENIKKPRGDVRLAMFSNSEGYSGKGSPVRAAVVSVASDTVTATFEGLEPGTYAIRAFHDVDGDGKMDTNLFGMPTEPFAFSNNAKARGGPAAWDEASFKVVSGANRIRISIK